MRDRVREISIRSGLRSQKFNTKGKECKKLPQSNISFFIPVAQLAHAPTVPVSHRGVRYLGVPLLYRHPNCHKEVVWAAIFVPGDLPSYQI